MPFPSKMEIRCECARWRPRDKRDAPSFCLLVKGMKIAIIGCGSIGQRHASNLYAIGTHELLLVDPNMDRAEKLGRQVGARAFGASEDAYAEMPTLSLICAPTSLHLEMAWEAIEKGCHVFVEKPLSDSMTGVPELIDAAERRGRFVFVGYNFRFDPVVRRAHQWVKEGNIGQVTSARFHFGSYLPWRHPQEDYRLGYGSRRELGGGVILDAVHELDLAIWFFGMPDAGYAQGGRCSDLEIDVEDTAEILLSYEDKTVSVHLDYVQMPPERRFQVTGTRGSVRADLFARTAEYFDGNTRKWQKVGAPGTLDDSYRLEMAYLLECVTARAEPLVNGRVAAQSLLLATKAKESMKSGLTIQLNVCAQEMCAR